MDYSYAIVGDVTCDLSKELRDRFRIDGYVKGHITIPGGQELDSELEWSFTNARDFYASLKSNLNAYKTASASREEIAGYWEPFLAAGKDVLALSISGALSVTYKLMTDARDELIAKYPSRKIVVIDSQKYSSALGLLTTKASLLRTQGLTLDENAAELNRIKNSIHQMGSMDDLFYVASKGRISHSKAFLGTLVGIKPMGDFDSSGMVTVLAKVRGFEKAFRVVVEYMNETIVKPEDQIVIVAQTAREKQAEELAKLIESSVRPKEVIMSDIYPATGINIGPGLLAAYYFGTEITDLAYETKVMSAILEGL